MPTHKENKSKLHNKRKKIQQLSSSYSLDILIIMSLSVDVISKELMQFPFI